MATDRECVAEQLLAVRYGTWTTSLSHCFPDIDRDATPDAPLQMDYFFWILRRRDATIVIDTGFRPEVGMRRGRTCLLDPRQALARAGVEPASVELVLITHMHYDHTGNIGLFPNAEIIIDEREFAFWTDPGSSLGPFSDYTDPADLAELAAARERGRVRLASADEEVAPGVRVRRVGGHTAGQQIVLVEIAGTEVVLTSDAVHFYLELECDWPFAIREDLAQMSRAYELLRRLQAEGATLVAGHDPLVMQHFPRLDDWGAQIA